MIFFYRWPQRRSRKLIFIKSVLCNQRVIPEIDLWIDFPPVRSNQSGKMTNQFTIPTCSTQSLITKSNTWVTFYHEYFMYFRVISLCSCLSPKKSTWHNCNYQISPKNGTKLPTAKGKTIFGALFWVLHFLQSFFQDLMPFTSIPLLDGKKIWLPFF